jgi:hypothetical protein
MRGTCSWVGFNLSLYTLSNTLPDIVDYHDPTMLIVGSRGLGQLKGYVHVNFFLNILTLDIQHSTWINFALSH